MAAKISNTPNYIIIDRSFNQSVSTDIGVNPSTAGTPQNMIDGDLTTYYSAGSSGGAIADVHAYIIIDYGRPVNSYILSYKVYFAENGASVAAADYKIDVSRDGSGWTTLRNGTRLNNSITIEDSWTGLQMRYVRFYNKQQITSDTTLVETRVFECRVYGAVN